MPGGPIDPNRIISLIKSGTPYQDEGLLVGRDVKRLDPAGGHWSLANAGHHLSSETYDILLRCTPIAGNLFTVGSNTYQLASEARGSVLWAVHQTV